MSHRTAATLARASLASFAIVSPGLAEDGPTPQQIMQAWANSPHADASAETFTHWDEEGEVPADCAVCHTSAGFVDYAGGAAVAPGVLSHPVPAGGVVDCDACHSDASRALETVVFPSGETVGDLGASTVCTVCHQGRSSTDAVEAALQDLDPDAVSAELQFLNVHYRAAAATLFGGAVRGGYQYPGQDYVGRFAHPPPFESCTGCHDAHTLEPAVEACTACHQGADDPTAIRARPADVDGDGDAAEGVAHEIATLKERLLAAIGVYALEVAGTPVAYAPDAYPYFFVDTDGDGAAGATEAAFPNRYNAWTPRLLRAAYNFQFVEKDPGAYAHNPSYAMQLLIDSLRDLSEVAPVETADLTRP